MGNYYIMLSLKIFQIWLVNFNEILLSHVFKVTKKPPLTDIYSWWTATRIQSWLISWLAQEMAPKSGAHSVQDSRVQFQAVTQAALGVAPKQKFEPWLISEGLPSWNFSRKETLSHWSSILKIFPQRDSNHITEALLTGFLKYFIQHLLSDSNPLFFTLLASWISFSSRFLRPFGHQQLL